MTTTATTTTASTQVVRRKSLRLLEAAAARAALENGDHDNDKCVPVAAAKEAAPLPSIRQSLRSSSKRKSCSSSIATNESNDKQADASASSSCAPKKSKPRKRRSDQKTKTTNEDDDDSSTELRKECLPRTRERQLLQASFAGQEDTTSSDCSSTRSSSSSSTIVSHVMGIDEAGRGPLCGPVVAAAAVVPTDLAGITDSKKLTKEHVREDLYEQIVTSPNVRWAVAVMDAARIDQINILQATLQGMQWAAQGVMGHRLPVEDESGKSQQQRRQRLTASCHETGCYVVCGATDSAGKPLELEQQQPWTADSVVALVDGNKIPADMPCRAECMVKGDSREYAIAAASILAKVTRDRLMRGYHELYPAYDMKQNKGYPTAAHMAAVRKHGASPIHRRSFAPLKHMEFNEKGEILQDNS